MNSHVVLSHVEKAHRRAFAIEQRIFVRPWAGVDVATRSFGSSGSKRRRRSKSLSKSSAATTTRDRLRQVVERNQRPVRLGDTPSVDQLTTRAAERLTWLRTKLYQHWNPDYRPSDAVPQLDESGALKVVPRRKQPRGVVMNGRWWFWNICFALLPAALLAIYCEFRVKPIMIAHYAREKQRTRKKYGEISGGGADGADVGMGATLADEVTRNQDASLSDRLHSFWNEVQSFLARDDLEKDEKSDHAQPKETAKVEASEKQTLPEQPVASLPPVRTDVLTLKTLASRLDRLERLLVGEKAATNTKEAVVAPSNTPDDKADRMQSGIHRRVEQKRRMQYQAELEAEEASASKETTMTQVTRWVSFAWTALSGFLEDSGVVKSPPDGQGDGTEGDANESTPPDKKPSTVNASNGVSAPASAISKQPDTPQKYDKIKSPPNEQAKNVLDELPDDSTDATTKPWWKFW